MVMVLVGLEHTWELFLVMFLDYFGGFGLDFWKKKGRNHQNLGNIGVLRRGVGIPMQQRRPTPRRGTSTPWRG